MGFNSAFKGLNPIRHLLTFVWAHHILHVSRVRVNYIKSLVFELCSLVLILSYCFERPTHVAEPSVIIYFFDRIFQSALFVLQNVAQTMCVCMCVYVCVCVYVFKNWMSKLKLCQESTRPGLDSDLASPKWNIPVRFYYASPLHYIIWLNRKYCLCFFLDVNFEK